jgi:phosphoglycolate phosphatase
VKNYIFDVDGTLLDSREDIAGAQLWVLQRLGVESVTKEDLYPHIGKILGDVFRLFLPEQDHGRITEAKRMYLARYRPRALDTTTLFPGVESTIARLHAGKQGLAVATTKSTKTAHRVLNHFGIAQYFDPIQGTDETPPKPDPYVLHTVLEKRSWSRHETLYVGDSPADILCAQNAGVRMCAVTFGALDRAAAEQLKPDYIIDTFEDVLNL